VFALGNTKLQAAWNWKNDDRLL